MAGLPHWHNSYMGAGKQNSHPHAAAWLMLHCLCHLPSPAMSLLFILHFSSESVFLLVGFHLGSKLSKLLGLSRTHIFIITIRKLYISMPKIVIYQHWEQGTVRASTSSPMGRKTYRNKSWKKKIQIKQYQHVFGYCGGSNNNLPHRLMHLNA